MMCHLLNFDCAILGTLISVNSFYGLLISLLVWIYSVNLSCAHFHKGIIALVCHHLETPRLFLKCLNFILKKLFLL